MWSVLALPLVPKIVIEEAELENLQYVAQLKGSSPYLEVAILFEAILNGSLRNGQSQW